MVEHTRDPGLNLLLRDDLGDPIPNLTRALEVTPDGWRVTVVPRDVPSKILEDLDGAEDVLLVGGEFAFSRRRHLRRQPLPPPLGRELGVD